MSIQAIFSSKLYKASPRKVKIRAALNSPVNVELVQQLTEYLDDDSKELLENEIDKDTNLDTANPEGGEPSKGGSSGGSGGGGGSFSGGGGSFSGGGGGEFFTASPDGDIEEGFDDSESSGDVSFEDESEAPDIDDGDDVDSGTKIKGQAIAACYDPAQLPGQIKSTLNMREDTAGVERVATKECELWIYYNDKVNLNNVMSMVIEVLNAASYSYLNFNRLARTDNAIVFDIDLVNSEQLVEPIEEKDIEPIGNPEDRIVKE